MNEEPKDLGVFLGKNLFFETKGGKMLSGHSDS